MTMPPSFSFFMLVSRRESFSFFKFYLTSSEHQGDLWGFAVERVVLCFSLRALVVVPEHRRAMSDGRRACEESPQLIPFRRHPSLP